MCLYVVTRKNAVAKNDMAVWKKVFNTGNNYHSLFAANKFHYDNKAQNLFNGGLLTLSEKCKPGLCVFRRKKDAKRYMDQRPLSSIGNYRRLNNPQTIVIRCLIPKGTKISHGLDDCSNRMIVSQRLIIPELKDN